MSDTESTATNEKLAPLLSKNRRIYIKHNFNRDGIHRFLNAEWQGVWHLACVSSPWDEESGTFEVLWSRNGQYEKHTMKYKPHLIQPFHPNPKSILLIEDDDKTYDKPSHIHYAHFHSFGKGNDNINIRWESTREVEEIDLSRVCLDIRLMGRRRQTNFYSDESVKLEKGGEGGGAYKKKRGRKKDTVIELLDSSDDDDEELMNSAPVAKIVSPEEKQLTMLDGEDSSDEELDASNKIVTQQEQLYRDDCSDEESDVSDENNTKLPSSGSNSNSSSRDNSESSDEDQSLFNGRGNAFGDTQPLSCKGSLRKSRTKYNEQLEDHSSVDFQNCINGRRLDMNLISSDTESNNAASSAAAKQSVSESSENDGVARKRKRASARVLLSGYSVSDTNSDYASYLSTMAYSLKKYKEDPIEFEDILTEVHATIQEKLYKIKDRTTLEIDPQLKYKSSEDPTTKKDGNMTIIYEAATNFGLSSSEIDDLFADLGDPDETGFFSINDAVLLMLRMSEGKGDPSWTAAGMKSSRLDAGKESSGLGNLTDHVGRRVKTVLEDGQEYSGTISNVTFRVKYDDGDTETQTEKEVWENLIDNDNYLSEQDTSGKMLELFSGCSLLSTMCKRKGMNVISVDIDQDSNATMKANFMSEHVQSLLYYNIQDYIHASPVCSTYSAMAGSKHRDKDNYNKSAASHKADEVLMKLYLNCQHQLQKNPDCIITIENPRGWMMKGNIMKMLFEELGFKMYQIYYCQFGRDEMKPTCIFTNDEKLGDILVAIGGRCKCKGNHKDSVQESSSDTNFAALPFELCKVLSSYVHSKITQLKFDKLIRDK